MQEKEFKRLRKYEDILYKVYGNKFFNFLESKQKYDLADIYRQITGNNASGCCFKDDLFRLSVWYFDYKQKNKTDEQGTV